MCTVAMSGHGSQFKKKPAFNSACVCQHHTHAPAQLARESLGVFCNYVFVDSWAKSADGVKLLGKTKLVGLDCPDFQ